MQKVPRGQLVRRLPRGERRETLCDPLEYASHHGPNASLPHLRANNLDAVQLLLERRVQSRSEFRQCALFAYKSEQIRGPKAVPEPGFTSKIGKKTAIFSRGFGSLGSSLSRFAVTAVETPP